MSDQFKWKKFDEINTSDRTRTPDVYITSHHITLHHKHYTKKNTNQRKIHKEANQNT